MDWKDAQNRGETIFAVFVDFKRAFETLDIDILLYILVLYGFHELAVRLMASYLKNRKQKVKIGDILSDEIFNNLGVPQGSSYI